MIGSFRQDSRGNVAIIVALVFIPMLVLAGGATDLARYEAFRVALQDGIDRGVLAAAALTQTKPSEETVRDYISTLSFIDEVALDVDEQKHINGKVVTAQARYVMPTAFLPLIGIDTLTVGAVSRAEDKRQNIELSLMLDFSGSMAGTKYKTLKIAAKEFVDAIFRDEADTEHTTMSIVPYAGQVSVGEAMFNTLVNLPSYPERRDHWNSSCFEMRDQSDFGTGQISFIPRKQVPHFTAWNATNFTENLNPGWCPSDDTSIVYLSNDPEYLKSRIDSYRMYDGTGTAIAVNWGYMLLDPSSQGVIGAALANGLMNPVFANRPAPFNDTDTIKFIVLMTDGAITEQFTALDPNAPVRTAGNTSLLTTPTQNRDRMYQVCDAAKANGVTVYTIGFQVNSQGAQEMRNCATTSDHYYDVQGLAIDQAFASIASAIQKVKLTQ